MNLPLIIKKNQNFLQNMHKEHKFYFNLNFYDINIDYFKKLNFQGYQYYQLLTHRLFETLIIDTKFKSILH